MFDRLYEELDVERTTEHGAALVIAQETLSGQLDPRTGAVELYRVECRLGSSLDELRPIMTALERSEHAAPRESVDAIVLDACRAILAGGAPES